MMSKMKVVCFLDYSEEWSSWLATTLPLSVEEKSMFGMVCNDDAL